MKTKKKQKHQRERERERERETQGGSLKSKTVANQIAHKTKRIEKEKEAALTFFVKNNEKKTRWNDNARSNRNGMDVNRTKGVKGKTKRCKRKRK